MFSAACCQNASSPLHCTDVRVRPATTVAAEPSSNELLVKEKSSGYCVLLTQ